MSKRKGVSADEKKKRVLELFHEKKDFFQLKELEKIAPKEKGVIAQSVKDVVQGLVDDGLVSTDKIGTSTYFWSFPSEVEQVKKRKLEELSSKVEACERDLKKTKEKILRLKEERVETEERKSALEKNKELKAQEGALLKAVAMYKDSDPEALDQTSKDIKTLKEGINRWTDNIFSIKSWCKGKFSVEEAALDKQFDIPPDLDYVDT